MSKNNKNQGTIIMGTISGNSETGEINNQIVVFGGDTIKSVYETVDKMNHELAIIMVKSNNDLVNIERREVINKLLFAAFFGIITAYNIFAISTGKNILGILNYIAAVAGSICFIDEIIEIIKALKPLLVSRKFVKVGNEFIEENYPEEVNNVNAPKTLRKLFKNRKCNEEKEI